MAASGYNQEYRRWPSGTIQNPKLPPAQRMSWQVGVGSFIESSNPLAVINRSEAFNSEYNEPIFDRASGKATFFKCPTFRQPPNSQFSYLTTMSGSLGSARIGELSKRRPAGRILRIRSDDSRRGCHGWTWNTMTIIETNAPTAQSPKAAHQPFVASIQPAANTSEKAANWGISRRRHMCRVRRWSVRFVGDSIDPKTFETFRQSPAAMTRRS